MIREYAGHGRGFREGETVICLQGTCSRVADTGYKIRIKSVILQVSRYEYFQMW